MNEKMDKPKYQQISIEFARQVVSGKYEEGQKISGRSVLASSFNVSPETIRRSMFLLKEMDVVEISQGSGIKIKSKENARKFIDEFDNMETVTDLSISVKNKLDLMNSLQKELKNETERLLSYTSKYNHTNDFMPYEIKISGNCEYIGKTLKDIKFWNNTGATVIAIKHNNKTQLSPGPYAYINDGDSLFLIGTEENYVNTKIFLKMFD